MNDLDEILSAHVRDRIPGAQPPLAALRRRAVRRRHAAAGSLLAAGAVAVGLSFGVTGLGGSQDVAGPASGDLTPREPSAPDLGVLAGRVQEVPEPTQRPVTLRFTDADGGMSVDVATRQGGTWQVELAAGRWRITALEGGGVCDSIVDVVAGGWQRTDLAWPCDDAPAGPGAPNGAPSASGTIEATIGERVRATLDLRCGVGPISVDGEFFYSDTYAAPGSNPPGWTDPQPGWATRVDRNTVRFLADNSTIRITFRRDAQRQPPLCPAR